MLGKIYFIGCDLTGLIKIGFTTGSCESRLKTLQIGSPGVLSLLASISGTMKEEGLLHKHFAGSHYRGEWFKPNAEFFSILSSGDRARSLLKILGEERRGKQLLQVPVFCDERSALEERKRNRRLRYEKEYARQKAKKSITGTVTSGTHQPR